MSRKTNQLKDRAPSGFAKAWGLCHNLASRDHAFCGRGICFSLVLALLVLPVIPAQMEAQVRPAATKSTESSEKPKLVVLLVVDQMRGEYVDKFRFQWSGGLKRIVEEGAWFRDAAYPYAATETCVGHSTISTGAVPATHGTVANAWWDRETQKLVTCTF